MAITIIMPNLTNMKLLPYLRTPADNADLLDALEGLGQQGELIAATADDVLR